MNNFDDAMEGVHGHASTPPRGRSVRFGNLAENVGGGADVPRRRSGSMATFHPVERELQREGERVKSVEFEAHHDDSHMTSYRGVKYWDSQV